MTNKVGEKKKIKNKTEVNAFHNQQINNYILQMIKLEQVSFVLILKNKLLVLFLYLLLKGV